MTLKKKLSKLKDAIEYETNIDENIENELVIGINKHVQDAKCDLISFVQQTLNLFTDNESVRSCFTKQRIIISIEQYLTVLEELSNKTPAEDESDALNL
ncbi:hypothetical protein AVEN_72320-1 [Araneus ventricosus]|uniref:Uncharacterized protein n=1 Tax=Araneus ventricosus TaxID=182803 RepID=A0A4Y2U4J4_ARAVE|nr:hypothetical protein AVEN_72320-1 [Araneus ventricosus]